MKESNWKRYLKTAEQEMRPYVPGEDLTVVSVSERDTPEEGGMIARGDDKDDLWYVSKEFFEKNYKPVENSKSIGLDLSLSDLDNDTKSKIVVDLLNKVFHDETVNCMNLFYFLSTLAGKREGYENDMINNICKTLEIRMNLFKVISQDYYDLRKRLGR